MAGQLKPAVHSNYITFYITYSSSRAEGGTLHLQDGGHQEDAEGLKEEDLLEVGASMTSTCTKHMLRVHCRRSPSVEIAENIYHYS